jgi:hypothetical protein
MTDWGQSLALVYELRREIRRLSQANARLQADRKSSRFPTATGGRGAGAGEPQFVRRAWGSVTVPGLASAARTAWSR